WAAQQPQQDKCVASGKPSWQFLGLLRPPTRGKPARHRKRFSLERCDKPSDFSCKILGRA
ncbi:hypothetical protein J1G35_16730, partial [Pseudomonas sp. SH10-3B]|uniref:hypothetical protein n=1 Tax=Pseudomonas sp. SH10-3B TaxID=2816049 RepID=UPI001CA7A984